MEVARGAAREQHAVKLRRLFLLSLSLLTLYIRKSCITEVLHTQYLNADLSADHAACSLLLPPVRPTSTFTRVIAMHLPIAEPIRYVSLAGLHERRYKRTWD